MIRRVLAFYAVMLAIACAGVYARSSTHTPDVPIVVASKWKDGVRVARAVAGTEERARSEVGENGWVVFEHVVGTAPVPRWDVLRALSFAPSIDGVRATLGDDVAYLTPDDLIAHQAYDRYLVMSEGLSMGLDLELVYALLGNDLHAAPSEIKARAKIERVRFERHAESPASGELRDDDVRNAMNGAAAYVARGMSSDGRYRYMVDAQSNRTRSGYDWPRHAGTTYFLAQSGRLGAGPAVLESAKRAANRIRDVAMSSCGAHKCVGQDDPVEIGSSALSALAFAELAKSDPSYTPAAIELADFLRAQQRADGELMHYCSKDGAPVDRQTLYFSGEAALALARVHALGKRPEDLEAARRAVAYLTGPAWSFVGDRYLFGEEHWTCQAAAELWDRAKDAQAIDFCVRWMEWNDALQAREGDAPFDVDGAIWLGPLAAPRTTPVASRAEAGVAILSVAARAGIEPRRIARLEAQMQRSIAFLVRHQLSGPHSHLLADPAAVAGAMPGSTVDFSCRIDFSQHAGSAMGRWLERPRNP